MKLTQTHYALLALLFGALMVLLALFLRGGGSTQVDEVHSYTSLAPAQFEERITSGDYTVIDIRTPEETMAGKVTPDALEFDYYQPAFPEQLASLDRDGSYLIYCNSGNRTSDALQLMRTLGFTNVHDLKGGKVAWERSGRALVPPAVVPTQPPAQGGTQITCPADAKLCADGTSVGRVGPDCEFAPCT